jgi:hypothetical protein
VVVQPQRITAVRLRFAALLKAALQKNPMRPRDGYTQNAFTKELKTSAARVSQWCNGKATPKNRATLETAIEKLYGKHPDFEGERNKLRVAWEAVVQEKNQKYEEVRRSVAKARGILLPSPQDRSTPSWTLENIADLIAHGQLTYVITDQVIRAMKCATIVERSQIVQALVQILVEPTSSQSDWRIKEIAAAILSKVYTWRPTDFEQRALLVMSHRDLASSWASLSVAAPVSIALARAGYPEPLQRSLNKLMLDQEHGRVEFHRGASYYGSEFLLFNGVMDHFRNRRRAGSADLIYAFDTHCLMRLVESPTLPTPHKRLLKPKLLVSAHCLYKAGLEEASSCAEKKGKPNKLTRSSAEPSLPCRPTHVCFDAPPIVIRNLIPALRSPAGRSIRRESYLESLVPRSSR